MAMEMTDFDELQKLLWSFAGHRVITVAGRTGILNRLARGSATIEDLAGDLGLDPLATGKIVRALNALGVVEPAGQGYRIREPYGSLFNEGPDDFAAFLEHSNHLYDSWGENLESWLRGKSWVGKKRTSEGILQFGKAMQAMAAVVANRAAEVIGLDGVERMLDVGGGFGAYARAFGRTKPYLRATVLDTPQVAELARAANSGAGTDRQIEFIGGDYLKTDYGSGYDLVLFANVLHQEPPQRAAEMIRRAASSLNPKGRVAVIDFSIDDEKRQNVMGALFAINMRSFGDTYTEPAIRQWMTSAGLVRVERFDLSEIRWIITGRKPG